MEGAGADISRKEDIAQTTTSRVIMKAHLRAMNKDLHTSIRHSRLVAHLFTMSRRLPSNSCNRAAISSPRPTIKAMAMVAHRHSINSHMDNSLAMVKNSVDTQRILRTSTDRARARAAIVANKAAATLHKKAKASMGPEVIKIAAWALHW